MQYCYPAEIQGTESERPGTNGTVVTPTLIASSLRSTSKKSFCPMTRSFLAPTAACGQRVRFARACQRVRFARTWREEFFEVPFGNSRGEQLTNTIPSIRYFR